ncbi:hypothetical protein [Stenotrophomonas sp.]|uniref:hypothetical protein n=1 Tax=Stenotrophomonas sp. TaxID=69392 RepID=UPI00289DCE58|nr:hypothetical protein [Stenotrophomonas sp.]
MQELIPITFFLCIAYAIHQEQRHAVPDVNEALQRRLQVETRDSGVLYVVVQALLFGALLAAASWYFWH